MERVRRPRISTAEKTEVWTRWKRGESLSDIGRAVDRVPGTIFHVLAARGGVSPTRRTRSWLALTLTEREEISRGLARGCSLRGISASLGRAPSTISREVRRHGGRARYRASVADARTWRRAHRPKPCRLTTSAPRRALVATKLAAAWSPQQIAGWLKRTFPDHPHMQVSHETIYVSLFVQSRGVLKKALIARLRRRRRMRRSKQAAPGQQGGGIIDAVSIRERPAEAEDRAVPGHWEGDMLSGARNSHIATLVERQSRFVLLVRLPGKDTASVVEALSRAVRALPDGLMASLTWDRGGGNPEPPWVLLTPTGHPVDGDNLRRRVFYRLLEQAGLRKIRLHDLRHTYASLLIQQGESLAYVQQQLGHSSVQVTVDVYGHLIPGANRAAVDRLDAQPPRNPAATSANPSRTRKALSGCKNWSRRADSNRGPADDESAQPASSCVQGRPFLREFRLVYWVIVRRRPAPSTRVALRLALSSWEGRPSTAEHSFGAPPPSGGWGARARRCSWSG